MNTSKYVQAVTCHEIFLDMYIPKNGTISENMEILSSELADYHCTIMRIKFQKTLMSIVNIIKLRKCFKNVVFRRLTRVSVPNIPLSWNWSCIIRREKYIKIASKQRTAQISVRDYQQYILTLWIFWFFSLWRDHDRSKDFITEESMRKIVTDEEAMCKSLLKKKEYIFSWTANDAHCKSRKGLRLPPGFVKTLTSIGMEIFGVRPTLVRKDRTVWPSKDGHMTHDECIVRREIRHVTWENA